MIPVYRYLQTTHDLQQAVSELLQAAPAVVGIDTEFTRQHTYWPILELVQLAYHQTILIVDCRVIDCLEPLKDVLQHPTMDKVFHAARQDIEGLFYRLQIVPNRVIDLQIAAAFSGYGPAISLRDLVKALLGDDIDKGQQFGHWHQRPLTQDQLTYAARDAWYLIVLYPLIESNLIQLGRQEWPQEYYQQIMESIHNALSPLKAWQRLGHYGLSRSAVIMASALAMVRETIAQELNISRQRILEDIALIEWVRHEDRLPQALLSLSPNHQHRFNDMKSHIIQALQDPLVYPVLDRLYRSQKTRKHQLTDDARQRFHALQQSLAVVADHLAIPVTYLASTDMVFAYIDASDHPHPFTTSWRAPHVVAILEEIQKPIKKAHDAVLY